MALLDRNFLTTAREKLSLWGAPKHQTLTRAQPGEVREFTAIALTDAIPLSSLKLEEYANEGVTTTSGSIADSDLSRYSLKAKIVGDANGNEFVDLANNPHNLLVDPCALGQTADVNKSLQLIKQYTTYITATDFNESGGNHIRRNDRIKVRMIWDPEGRIIMERGDLVALVETAAENETLKDICASLSGLFDSNASILLGTPSAVASRLGEGSYDVNLDSKVCEPGHTDFYLNHPLQSPAKITSPYGMRDLSNDGVVNPTMHSGMDIGAAIGTPVYAAAAGTLWLKDDGGSVQTGWKTCGGNIATVNHGTHTDGKTYKTTAMHLWGFKDAKGQDLKSGAKVEAGDQIGISGNSGTCSGDPHLHFTLSVNDKTVNPFPYIKTIQKCGATEKVVAGAQPFGKHHD